MRNIFLFVRRYFNLLFFLLLQGFCIYLIVHYNTYHTAVFSNTSNQLTGKVNEQYNKIEDFFYLKKTNDSLVKANERLYNKLRADFQLPDTASKAVIDTIKIDSLTQYRKYNYLQATVIENSVNLQSNFIVLNRGKRGGVKIGMGVIDINNAVVGSITDVSDDYAIVMSLLHKDSHVDGMLFKGNGETGTVNWDGKIPNILSMNRIPKSAKVAAGDTIISSGVSTTTIPKGKILGFITEVFAEKSSNNFLIKLKSAANFYNLQYVYVIDDNQQEAINQLLEKAKQQAK
ncbi:rod shape-determining protein MreC [Ferruginibacter sp.]